MITTRLIVLFALFFVGLETNLQYFWVVPVFDWFVIEGEKWGGALRWLNVIFWKMSLAQKQVCIAATKQTLNYPFLGSRKIPKPYYETFLTAYISSNLKTFHFIDEESEASKTTEKVFRYPGGFMKYFFSCQLQNFIIQLQ